MPDYQLAATRAAEKYGVNPAIFRAMIQQESGFNPNAKSGAGAQGIAQFMPGTAPGYGVNLHDNRVTDDLEGAAKYIAANLKRTGGNYAQALSIYNSGKPDAYKDPNFAGGQTYNYVKTILGNAKTSGGGASSARPPSSPTSTRTTTTTTTPGVDNSAGRAAAIAQFLGTKGSDPLAFAMQIRALQDVAGKTSTRTTGATAVSSSMGGGSQDYTSRANALNAKHLPYLYGGGHGQKQIDPYTNTAPLDCSATVSSVLGVDVRVSGEFAKFGQPGDGGNKGVTIYSNGHHVLMKIDGHFFGTSGSNPGGGAGWIKQQNISPQYLQGFTARHI